MGDNGAGKSTLVKIIAGNFPPTHGAMRMEGKELVLHKPIDARAARHRDRLSGTRALRQPDRRRQRLSQPRAAQVDRSDPRSSTTAMYKRAGELVQGAEVGDAAARSGEADVGRPAPGGGDRPHHAVGPEDRADGRADRGDLGAPGRRGAQPHPPSARPRHRRHPDQPPHARRVRGRATGSSCCGAARKVADKAIAQSSPEEVTGLITGAIERA